MKQDRKHKKTRAPKPGSSKRYHEDWEAGYADWDYLLHDDFIDDEYGEFDNGPFGRNSSNWQDPQDGFSSSGRGNTLKNDRKHINPKKYVEDDLDRDHDDEKRWRTPMGDW